MVGRIDAAARVVVLEPGAADGLVLLENDEWDAKLEELDARAESRFAGADDGYLEIIQPRVGGAPAPAHLELARPGELHLVPKERHVLVRHRLPDTGGHHP